MLKFFHVWHAVLTTGSIMHYFLSATSAKEAKEAVKASELTNAIEDENLFVEETSAEKIAELRRTIKPDQVKDQGSIQGLELKFESYPEPSEPLVPKLCSRPTFVQESPGQLELASDLDLTGDDSDTQSEPILDLGHEPEPEPEEEEPGLEFPEEQEPPDLASQLVDSITSELTETAEEVSEKEVAVEEVAAEQQEAEQAAAEQQEAEQAAAEQQEAEG